MFLISKYSNTKTLWILFALINLSLLFFIGVKSFQLQSWLYSIPMAGIMLSVLLFSHYCYRAYQLRIRKKTDRQIKVSLLSIAIILLPLLTLAVIVTFIRPGIPSNIVLLYGFTVFFGWLTAIIFGMTFKTLPFIVWNRIYHDTVTNKTPLPKALFSEALFTGMTVCYLAGFTVFVAGIIGSYNLLLQLGAVSLLASAIFYITNVTKTIFHKPV